MQKKLIALAVAGLMSGAAFAQTSVTVGGKFDASYQFKRIANADNAAGKNCLGNTVAGTVGDESCGGKTTETQGDGGNSTTRVSIGAKETIAPGYDIRVDFDIRFGNVHEGKTGLASNDKKAMAFTTPAGTLQWGVANLASNEYKLAEKPYMVSPKDTEIVKFGISQAREESLTNRNTTYWSPTLKMGPVQALVKASYAFGDNRKSDDLTGTDATTTYSIATSGTAAGTVVSKAVPALDGGTRRSGDVYVLGFESVIMDGIVDVAFDWTNRSASGTGDTKDAQVLKDSISFTHAYVNVRPIPGNKNLKLSAQYNTYRGWSANAPFQEKNTNFVLSYNFNGKAELGVGLSHLNDVGDDRNSGRGIMIGGSYFLSKSVQLYAGLQKTNYERNQTKVAKYVGTGAGFAGTFDKIDQNYVRVGIMKEF